MKKKSFFRDDHVYVIAEVAQNHDGSLGQAHAFIDAVADTGADAIKFQTHIADEESTKNEPFRVNFSYCDKTRYDYWKRMEFTEEQWTQLYNHAVKKGLDFLSSPFSEKALDMLNRIGIPAWKFGSGEVFNKRLLKKAIKTGKPIILSTGLSTFQDIDEQFEMINDAGNEVLLMQCTTAYPTSAEMISINVIEEYKERYGCPVGLSDHSATIFPSLSAVTLGALAVEVHVTMSRNMFGPDVKSSVTMEELSEIVAGARFIKKMLDNAGDKNELDKSACVLKQIFTKSIYARCDIKEGCIIKESDLVLKKPYCGNDANDFEKMVNCRAKNVIFKDEPIEWENIEK